MTVLFRNSNENNRLFFGYLVTSPENLQSQPWIDVTQHLDLEDKTEDWKHGHLHSVQHSDIVMMYPDMKTLRMDNSMYFV